MASGKASFWMAFPGGFPGDLTDRRNRWKRLKRIDIRKNPHVCSPRGFAHLAPIQGNCDMKRLFLGVSFCAVVLGIGAWSTQRVWAEKAQAEKAVVEKERNTKAVSEKAV